MLRLATKLLVPDEGERGTGRALRYAWGSASARRPTPTAVTFLLLSRAPTWSIPLSHESCRRCLASVRGRRFGRLLMGSDEDGRVRLLMTAPGVGPIVALTYAAAIDDPGRFRSSRAAGAHFGLTPKKYQSGETDVTGRISKIGDGGVRTALYEAANVILTRPVKGSTLKSWGMRLAARAGMRKAKVALARKLAVVLHRMLADGTNFLAEKAAVAAAR